MSWLHKEGTIDSCTFLAPMYFACTISSTRAHPVIRSSFLRVYNRYAPLATSCEENAGLCADVETVATQVVYSILSDT